MTTQYRNQREAEEDLERKAEAFGRLYGLDGTKPLDNETLERMLRDHGYPSLLALLQDGGGLIQARERGAHLVGHAIAGHEQPRCRACLGWGKGPS